MLDRRHDREIHFAVFVVVLVAKHDVDAAGWRPMLPHGAEALKEDHLMARDCLACHGGLKPIAA